jgi:hypothetical protein
MFSDGEAVGRSSHTRLAVLSVAMARVMAGAYGVDRSALLVSLEHCGCAPEIRVLTFRAL